jgi:hypothetical protein
MARYPNDDTREILAFAVPANVASAARISTTNQLRGKVTLHAQKSTPGNWHRSFRRPIFFLSDLSSRFKEKSSAP